MRKFNKNELVIVRPGCDHEGKVVCIKDAGFIIAKGVKTSSVVFDYRTTPPDPSLGNGLAMEHQLRKITEPHIRSEGTVVITAFLDGLSGRVTRAGQDALKKVREAIDRDPYLQDIIKRDKAE